MAQEYPSASHPPRQWRGNYEKYVNDYKNFYDRMKVLYSEGDAQLVDISCMHTLSPHSLPSEGKDLHPLVDDVSCMQTLSTHSLQSEYEDLPPLVDDVSYMQTFSPHLE